MGEEQNEIVNRVTESGLITLDLEDYYHQGERILFDIKPWLFREMILREKEFRQQIALHDWKEYTNKNIAFTCTADALIPTWAYMLLAASVQPYAHRYVFGNLQVLESTLYQDAVAKIDVELYRNARVIVKGCSDVQVPVSAYVELSSKLLPVVKTLMYGEACSNVPVYKNKSS